MAPLGTGKSLQSIATTAMRAVETYRPPDQRLYEDRVGLNLLPLVWQAFIRPMRFSWSAGRCSGIVIGSSRGSSGTSSVERGSSTTSSNQHLRTASNRSSSSGLDSTPGRTGSQGWIRSMSLRSITRKHRRQNGNGVNCPAHGGAGLVSELGLYPKSGGASVSG